MTPQEMQDLCVASAYAQGWEAHDAYRRTRHAPLMCNPYHIGNPVQFPLFAAWQKGWSEATGLYAYRRHVRG